MKTNIFLITLVLFGSLLASCGSKPRVGELQSETQSVELGDAESVLVKINMGAGDLMVTGGAEKLLEADFTYNVAKLKPTVEYTDDTLVVQQTESEGLPDLRGVTGFRNEWGLHLNDNVPMDLSVNVGAGMSDLNLASLPLNRLEITQGAGGSTVDLSGDWARDLNVAINTGATAITVRLPKGVGVRVDVEAGPHAIEASGLTQDGNIYTNSAYGVSDVTLHVDMRSGVGSINLEIEE
jgi:hypothetical protein